MTALLLAGARPRADERGLGTGDLPKTLLPVAGQTMLSRVANTLRSTPCISSIHMIAQEAEAMLRRAGLSNQHIDTSEAAASASLSVSNALANAWPYLVVTADHALLTPDIIEEFVDKSLATECDLCAGVVSRETLQLRFPNSRRTWLKFRGGSYTGANLFLLRNSKVRGALEVWGNVEQQRKKGRAIIGAFGPLLLLGALLRILTLDQAIAAAGRKVGCRATAIYLGNAEAAIDVDTQADLEQAEDILNQRGTTT
ncbi:MAG: NTP transferase domain-containing protein [Pacificimonas sp.]